MILNNGRCIRMHGSGRIFRENMEGLRQRYRIIGFYIQFNSKTMNRARAYFPSLCSRVRTTTFEPMCPVRSLIEVSSQGLMKKSFVKNVNRGKKFERYFKRISWLEEAFAPYALRIGGRTWMLNQGMTRQVIKTYCKEEASF